MKVITLKNNKIFASNCYVLLSEEAFSVVDPSVSYENALAVCPEIESLRAEYVLLTHGHVDHFWEINSYVKRGCKVIISEKDARLMADPKINCAEFLCGNIDSYKGDFETVRDGDIINLCDGKLTVIETPGHTAGSVSFLADGVIFTGDTLFAGGVFGRYDLPTSSGVDLLHSLKRLFSLSEDLIVYSGHGDVTTMKMTKQAFYKREEI